MRLFEIIETQKGYDVLLELQQAYQDLYQNNKSKSLGQEIVEINLHGTNIGNEGARVLSHAIKTATLLKALNLGKPFYTNREM